MGIDPVAVCQAVLCVVLFKNKDFAVDNSRFARFFKMRGFGRLIQDIEGKGYLGEDGEHISAILETFHGRKPGLSAARLGEKEALGVEQRDLEWFLTHLASYQENLERAERAAAVHQPGLKAVRGAGSIVCGRTMQHDVVIEPQIMPVHVGEEAHPVEDL